MYSIYRIHLHRLHFDDYKIEKRIPLETTNTSKNQNRRLGFVKSFITHPALETIKYGDSPKTPVTAHSSQKASDNDNKTKKKKKRYDMKHDIRTDKQSRNGIEIMPWNGQ